MMCPPWSTPLISRLHSTKSMLPLPTKCFLWCRVWCSFLLKFFEAPVIIIWFNSLSFNGMKCPLIIFMLCILYSVEWTHDSSFGTKLHCINYISNYIHFALPLPVCSHPSLSVIPIRVSGGHLLSQNSSGWEWSFPLEPFYRHSFPSLW